jgi:hypothetical protein
MKKDIYRRDRRERGEEIFNAENAKGAERKDIYYGAHGEHRE